MIEENATPEKSITVIPEQPTFPVAESQRVTVGKLLRRTIFDLNELELSRLKIMAQMYAASAFNHKGKQKEGDFFLIMLKGLELGIAPMAAVDTINIIAGKPVLDAKGQLALVKSSGLLEDIQIDSTAERCIVTIKRLGEETAHIVSFTIQDAHTFMTTEWGEDGKKTIPLSQKSNWKSQPAVMLKWRAVTAALREVFPDVINGLNSPEELDTDNVIVHDDGSMKYLGTGEKPEQASAQSKITPIPTSPNAKKLDETTAWHQESGNITKALGHCAAKGWIEGTTIAEQLASFASLVGKEIVSFETGKSAIDAAEEAATKAANATTTGAWDTLDGIQAIVTWAKGKGYGDSEPALLKLLDVKDWKVFADGRAACAAIAEAHTKKADKPAESKKESGKLNDEDLFAVQEWASEHFNLTPSYLAEKVDFNTFSSAAFAQKYIKTKAREEAWPVVAEKVTYVVKKNAKGVETKSLRFETVLGEISYFKGRTEFSKIVGETYANDNGIPNLNPSEEHDIEPLLLTWKARENYNEVVDALPLMEPEPTF